MKYKKRWTPREGSGKGDFPPDPGRPPVSASPSSRNRCIAPFPISNLEEQIREVRAMYGWKSDRSLTLKEEHRSLATLLTRLSKEDPERDLGPVQAAIKKAVRQSIADNQIRVDEWGNKRFFNL